MKRYALLLILISVVMVACSNSDCAYESARKTDTIEEYRNFLKRYPSDRRNNVIIERIEELSWNGAQHAKTITSIDSYIESYPKGKFIEEAKLLRGKVELDNLPVFEGVISVTMISSEQVESGVLQMKRLLCLESGGKEYRLNTSEKTHYKGIDVSVQGVHFKLGKRYKVQGALGGKSPTGVASDGVQFIDARVVQRLIDPKTDGTTELIAASFNGQNKVVQNLLDAKADVNAGDAHGGFALGMASYCGHQEIVQMLLAAKADVNVMKGDGPTALMSASRGGQNEVVKMLIAAKADVNAKTSHGGTALMEASFKGYKEIVQTMIDAGADLNAKDRDGFTALKLALRENHQEVVQTLNEAGAKE